MLEAQDLIEDQEFRIASHVEGMRFYIDSQLKDPRTRAEYKLLTPISKFAQHGVGLQLYFELMRAMAFTFLGICIYSIAPICINYKGDWLEHGDIRYFCCDSRRCPLTCYEEQNLSEVKQAENS
jgi:hypothetical protein